MQAVYRHIEAVAGSSASVFIHGESGTGKELAAAAIHRLGPRAERECVALSCAAIPADLLESELFGHVRGAFTSAHADRDGAFLQADGGTLFLDEVAELDLSMQAKLLRVLQTGEVRRVGEGRMRQGDVRVVCASHRDLKQMVADGQFREDLFYRLHVVPLQLPPLRARGEDIVLLAHHFLQHFNRMENKAFEDFEPEVLAVMCQYRWPGNVRELMNAVHAMVVMNPGPHITQAMCPEHWHAGPLPLPAAPWTPRPLAELEQQHISLALQHYGHNIRQAALALGIDPSTLHRKLKRQGLSSVG